ncbi:MAG: hypothetical protein J0L75_09240 [Spirochaetes bacterium]|nr:hypothetical protein [Spirochaetota bacterium]
MRRILNAAALILALAATAQARPAIGAIRWDAWMQGSNVTRAVEKTLSPSKYHFRVPFFGVKTAAGGVAFPTYTQEIFDQELRYAKAGGVDYFAYCTYPTNDGMYRGLEYHRASRLRDQVKFCLLMHQSMVTSWPDEVKLVVSWLKEPYYHKTPDGRPIIFAFESGVQKMKGRVEDLAAAAQAAGLKRPYFAWMGWNPLQAYGPISEFQFDAFSAYAKGITGHDRFVDYAADIRNQYWEAAAGIGLESIPFAGCGWDRRCRDENPTPWDRGIKAVADAEANPFTRPTPAELADHVKAALDWASENRALVPAQSLVMYAWNEHDEGGWLCPTWGEGGRTNTDRLDALAAMLARYQPPPAKARALARIDRMPMDGLALWLDASNPKGLSQSAGSLRLLDLSGAGCDGTAVGEARLVRLAGGKAAVRISEGGYIDVPGVATREGLTVFLVAQKPVKGGDPQARLASAYIANQADWKAPSWCIALDKEANPFPPRVHMQSLSGVQTRGLRLGREMHTENSKFSGDIAEVIVYGRILSGGETLFIKSELEKKWTRAGMWAELSP